MRIFYLDGLRGMGACMVFFSHAIAGFFSNLGLTGKYAGIRFITDGDMAVFLFFIVSGYALTESVYGVVRPRFSALILKRYIRLSVPVMLSVGLAYSLLAAGLMSNYSQETSEWIKGYYCYEPNLGKAIFSAVIGVQLFNKVSYNPVLWSIKPEFLCSIALYLLVTNADRICKYITFLNIEYIRFSLFALIYCLLLAYHPLLSGFFAGFVFSSLNRMAFEAPVSPCASTIKDFLGIILLVLGIYASTYYRELYVHGYGQALYALIVFVGVMISRPLNRVFSSGPFKFLGDVSFPLYLTHFPVLCVVGPRFYDFSVSHQLPPIPTTIIASIIFCMISALVFMYIENHCLRLCYRAFRKYI